MSTKRWYFVCRICDAKWFHMKRRSDCPRCSRHSASRERLPVPWLKEQPNSTAALSASAKTRT